ncbi:PadR family transcriptional regulator [Natrialba taiwanensis]|uniref:PadR family transcriptional regulator n=1 Tax=Natrialba taiwanensis DSM 12281 TaxID=1230458 RepID=M0A7P4_9EURY|nr:helix-turn-helix transcriptional regulator [Natrialba taiwanensis]ELY94539.1 PadR family transcriptional regulator [Natrialba taiwanensis DSM 12281]
MRENTQNTESVFEALSKTAAAETAGGQSPSPAATNGPPDDVERELDDLLAQALSVLPTEDIEFTDELIKENLDEILLVLITLHDGTHGDELLSDLSRYFDTTLSPGTVYPALHALEEAGYLTLQRKVRTKEYSIAEDATVQSMVEETMIQQLAFGLLLSAFLARY